MATVASLLIALVMTGVAASWRVSLDDLRIGRTTLVVAHRLQTIVGSNCIWVIEAGRAVETGEHQELIARRGAYYAFFAAQFGARAALPIA